MDDKKIVLVTGACGFVGSHLVDHLLQISDLKVVATDLPAANRIFLNPACKFIPSNLCEQDSLRRVVKGVDVIYHAASLFRYSASWDDLYKVNVDGTRHLASNAAEEGVSKFVLISSSGVYGIPHFLLKLLRIGQDREVYPFLRLERFAELISDIVSAVIEG